MPNRKQSRKKPCLKKIAASIRAIDLFCGAGGLTKGLEAAGIDVRLGIDADSACKYPYTANSSASFLLKSVEDTTATDLCDIFKGAQFKLLAGCAPCQPFSTYGHSWSSPFDARWNLLEHFARLVEETQPHFVTMENVPLLKHKNVFLEFVSMLQNKDFEVFYDVVNCADYRVPQHRQRLVLLASNIGTINFIPPTTPQSRRMTVEQVINSMPLLEAGQICEDDPLHQASKLSPLNLKRIRASKPGGTWRDWEKGIRAECHIKDTGKTYSSVYGRMSWNDPSPTITTQFFGFGSGRFGHPEQDRAISLREGALLQSFPKNYKFVPAGEKICKKTVGHLIGNAVPVNLGKAIGKSIVFHVRTHLDLHE